MRPVRLTLLSLAITGIQPYSADPPPRIAASEDDSCLSVAAPRPERTALAEASRRAGDCKAARVPLAHQAMFGSGRFFSDLEFQSSDLGQAGAQQVRLKVGLGRDLFSGSVASLHAALDGSIARILGTTGPGVDQRLHLSLDKSFGGRWQTGLEAQVGALSDFALSQVTQRTGLVLVRTRYSVFTGTGAEHRLELKLSADTWQGRPAQPMVRRSRADLRYEFHQNSNILSVGLSLTDTMPHNGPGDVIRAEIRAMRRF